MRGYVCQCVSQIHAELRFTTCHRLIPLHQSLLINYRLSYTVILFYIANRNTHLTWTALHDSRQRSDCYSKFKWADVSMFKFHVLLSCWAFRAQQGSDLANAEHSIPLFTILLLRHFRNNACNILLCEQLHFHADRCTGSHNRTGVYELCQMCV